MFEEDKSGSGSQRSFQPQRKAHGRTAADLHRLASVSSVTNESSRGCDVGQADVKSEAGCESIPSVPPALTDAWLMRTGSSRTKTVCV